jgi:methionine aminopeptidase
MPRIGVGDLVTITLSVHFYALGGRSLDLRGLIADVNLGARVRMDLSSVIPDPTISRIAEAFSQLSPQTTFAGYCN